MIQFDYNIFDVGWNRHLEEMSSLSLMSVILVIPISTAGGYGSLTPRRAWKNLGSWSMIKCSQIDTHTKWI